MIARLSSALAVVLAFGSLAVAQDSVTPPSPGAAQPQGSGLGSGGQHGGGWGGGMGMGRGLVGTVTEAAADHYTIKTETGETYTVHYSTNTRILKQQPRKPGEGQGEGRGQAGEGRGEGRQGGGNPPTPIKPADIKVGDAIAAMGEIDAAAKSVGAVAVVQIDPERAKQMREMEANYGKTWLMGKVTAIDGAKVTLTGSVDHAEHSFVADENTSFRKRRDPITLADIQIGDMVRIEGAVKSGAFVATAVNALGAPPNGAPNGQRNGPPPTQPQ